MKKLVVFDLDGTLVDSEDFIVWSFTEAARILGFELNPDLIRELIGYPLEVVVSRILSETGLSESRIREFLDVRNRIVVEYWRSRVKLFPDVVPTLRKLGEMGFKLAVASSSRVERIVEFLGYFGVLGFFDYVSGVKPGIRGKPAPDVIIEVLEKTGIDASEALYIGDREVDCIAARNTLVDFILVDRRGNTNLNNCTPLKTVKTLLEIPVYLNAIRGDREI